MKKARIKTPLGIAELTGDKEGLASVKVLEDGEASSEIPVELETPVKQLQGYFKGELKNFDLKINPQGTEFQKKVWNKLLEIPFAITTSYLELSRSLGDEKAIRAVASANGKNPLWIIIPCHRVIGKDGSLTGYAGGLHRKKWLLDHENPPVQQSLF
ncbi:MAG: methylated-DNA--[protein]-cysteine S-methyltransferase [Gramella sp.]|nr:methylated-DNA--[protein]-cysteine S-methyltransferase [Christiangramia sp.]